MIKGHKIVREFKSGTATQRVLKGIDVDIKEGEFVGIMGRSGAGKSTLMYQLSLLDIPTSGVVTLDGHNTSELTNAGRTKFRLDNLGYVFQDYAVLPELTAIENVIVPLIMQGLDREEAQEMAAKALKRVKLDEHMNQLPARLSGGEQQRVSIARAIAHEPKIIFADEPTANLDSITADTVMKILDELHKKGQTIVMVTHEMRYGRHCDRILNLEDGQIEKEIRPNRHKY